MVAQQDFYIQIHTKKVLMYSKKLISEKGTPSRHSFHRNRGIAKSCKSLSSKYLTEFHTKLISITNWDFGVFQMCFHVYILLAYINTIST